MVAWGDASADESGGGTTSIRCGVSNMVGYQGVQSEVMRGI